MLGGVGMVEWREGMHGVSQWDYCCINSTRVSAQTGCCGQVLWCKLCISVQWWYFQHPQLVDKLKGNCPTHSVTVCILYQPPYRGLTFLHPPPPDPCRFWRQAVPC